MQTAGFIFDAGLRCRKRLTGGIYLKSPPTTVQGQKRKKQHCAVHRDRRPYPIATTRRFHRTALSNSDLPSRSIANKNKGLACHLSVSHSLGSNRVRSIGVSVNLRYKPALINTTTRYGNHIRNKRSRVKPSKLKCSKSGR